MESGGSIENLFCHTKAFKNIIENGLCTSPAKAIYDFMIQDVTISNKSLIPSRSDVGKHNCSIQISHAE